MSQQKKRLPISRAVQCSVLLAAMVFSGSCLAASLNGKVVDRDNNEPVEGAEVFLINTETQALVQSKLVKKDGKYKFQVPKEGEYDLMIRRHKYNSVRKRAIMVNNDKSISPIAMELSGWEVENVKAAVSDEEDCD